MSELPDRLGIFPLPQVVLFPDALLPLHVFEPRYRALVADALEGSKRFVVTALKPGYEANYEGNPEVYRRGCVGRIVEHEKLPDGCSDVILRGESIVEIESFVSDTPFRTARIRICPELDSFADGVGASRRVRELHELLESACPGCVEALREQMPGELEEGGGLSLLHTIAMHLPVEIESKIAWLSEPGSLSRWRAIRHRLRRLADARAQRSTALLRYADLTPEDPGKN